MLCDMFHTWKAYCLLDLFYRYLESYLPTGTSALYVLTMRTRREEYVQFTCSKIPCVSERERGREIYALNVRVDG